MPSQIQLTVAPPYEGDISCVRIDSASMKVIDAKDGEKVLVSALPRLGLLPGRQIRVKVAKADATDEGKGLIRISPDIQLFSIGEKVAVQKES